MTSVSHKDIVDDIIEGNGKSFEGDKVGGDIITHIIEYHNIFDRSPTWKLCRNKKEYEHAMKHGAFINPFLMWERKETLSDFQKDNSDIILPNSHNNYGVKDHRRKKETGDD